MPVVDADVPRPAPPQIARCERVHGHHDRRAGTVEVRSHLAVHCLLVGPEYLVDTGGAVRGPQIPIAGDLHILAQGRERVARPVRAIAVDDEPRVAAQDQRGIERDREPPSHLRSADVPRDVARERTRVDPEGAESSRDASARVVADQDRAAGAARIDYLEWRRLVGREQANVRVIAAQGTPAVPRDARSDRRRRARFASASGARR